ncbi:hypothetical protein [Pseudoalteromonas sp. T1lg75]|uniref:COG4648 family protein n=1 Tax=Pseudoalteromonas sp. T1lg75 TaxID=2077102 RepID=UPI000CF6E2E3|nr:hypothetical protein [Pseudoalteromonas sp. T1lg75]
MMLKGIVNALISLCLLAYPVLVYLGLSQGYEQQVAWLLALLLGGRALLALRHKAIGNWLLPISAVGLLLVLMALMRGSSLWLQLYPVMVNLIMATTFALSLLQKQSMVERFARLQEPQLSAQGVRYTRKVTMIWCAFFVLNGLAASYTVWLGDVALWTWYNGFIAYVLIGILAASEWTYRLWLKRQGKLV